MGFFETFLNLCCVVCGKDKSSGVPFHGVISQYCYFKKFELLCPFSKAAAKTQIS